MAVALYARVSTGRQAEKELSIPDQLRQMRDWCKRQGLAIGKEYVEPGVSATDDRRPQFQQMIADACQSPAPFEAIVVHSLSRFFRDHIESGIYQRKLRKFGVRLESISQPTGDDSTGWMVRNFFSIFDEYQSLENSKHTLRAMKENARQGFFNGSAPPFGYRKQPVDAQGRRGPKMRLIVDEAEAAVVRKIFKLYLQGERGMPLGMLGVADYLNERGLTRRGKPWGRGRVADVLRDSAYVGDYYFNKKCQKTGKAKPREEWIKLDLEPIVDRGTFARASERRSARRPENVAPRVLSSPTLLTGIAKCGCCGASMTLATGKGGRYRYYKCTNRINKGARACDSRNVRMERLDTAVLTSLATQVLAPGRIEALLAELAKRLQRSKASEAKRVHELQKELDELDEARNRLFEAVEKGLLPMDDALKQRSHKHQARRQALLTELAATRNRTAMPVQKLGPKQIEAFSAAVRSRLLEPGSPFAKRYLQLLVDEVRIRGGEATIRGSYASLAGAIAQTKNGHLREVPTFVSSWLPGTGSNRRPSD